MSRADQAERDAHEAARLRHFLTTGELLPRSFRHIDWCASTGPYLAPDCDCPDDAAEDIITAEQRVEESYFVDSDGTEYGPGRPGA